MHRKHGLGLFAGILACTALAISGCGSAEAPPAGTVPQQVPSIAPPPETGETGAWELVSPAHVTPESTTLRIGVTRNECASGITGKVLEPQVEVEATRIVIRAVVEKQQPGGYTCPSNNIVPVTVELPSPIGKRELFDAVCLDSHQLTTATCAYDLGIRWHP